MGAHPTTEEINALLPQTQCGDCDYDGCKPYAEAIATQGERIDRCPPGGIRGLEKLSRLTGQTITAEMRAEMQAAQKPRQVAVIREDICIGCKKCIAACPVDAILGGPKLMHTVITDECTGCELCIPPCPVDCIDLKILARKDDRNDESLKQQADHYRTRFEARLKRLEQKHQEKKAHYIKSKQKQSNTAETKAKRQAFIQEAIARAKQKK